MFELLNKEIQEYRVLNNNEPEIYMGEQTHKNIYDLYINKKYPFCGQYYSLNDLEIKGLVSIYKGVKIKKANFEYGYYLK